jgi:hypothetical protein
MVRFCRVRIRVPEYRARNFAFHGRITDVPLFYETCLARDLLYVKCFDYLTFDETVRVFAQLTRDPNHRVGRTE